MKIWNSGLLPLHAGLPLVWASLLVAASVLVILLPMPLVHGYVFAWLSCLNIILGAMAILLIWSLSGGHWGTSIASPLRALVATLPMLGLLSIPLWFSLDAVFPWAAGDCEQLDITAHQCRWLQPGLLVLRSGLCWAVWLGIAASMAVWSFHQPLKVSPARAAACLIGFVLLTSLFAVDWFMSLIPRSSTTMIGFLLISEQLVAGLALAILITSIGHWHDPANSERRKINSDLGNLLLSAVMFHGYCLYMDYLIVWEANLPGEIIWYTERFSLFGEVLMWMSAGLYIGLPILLLLFRRIKNSSKGLATVSTLLLLGHLTLVGWYLVPILGNKPGGWLWDWLMALCLVCLWIVAVGVLLNQRQTAGNADHGGR